MRDERERGKVNTIVSTHSAGEMQKNVSLQFICTWENKSAILAESVSRIYLKVQSLVGRELINRKWKRGLLIMEHK